MQTVSDVDGNQLQLVEVVQQKHIPAAAAADINRFYHREEILKIISSRVSLLCG